MFGWRGGFYDEPDINPWTGAPTRSAYRGYARKSSAAQRREDAAEKAFLKLVGDEPTAEALREARASRTPASFPLLTPATHLTAASWKDLTTKLRRTHGGTKADGGWKLKRRVATDAERRQFKVTRKGKVYFVAAVWTPPKAPSKAKGKKRTRGAGAGASAPLADLAPNKATNNKAPNAKKSKTNASTTSSSSGSGSSSSSSSSSGSSSSSSS